MKERSLPNQYLMLEAIKSRFDAREVKTGMERARELAARAEDYGPPPPPPPESVPPPKLFEEAA